MAVTLADVKAYLNVDYDYDDALITTCLENTLAYLHNAVDDYDDAYAADTNFAKVADAVTLSITSEKYNNRDPRNDNRSSFNYMIRSQIAQLQTWRAAT